jgi:hypothetical protein
MYEGLNDGYFMTLKVLPATDATSTATNITTTATQNSTSGAG